MRRDWIGTWSFFIDLTCALGIALAVIPVRSMGQEYKKPAGHITIGRDIPQHDAFRVGDKGQPTKIATAREDLVLSGARTVQEQPQSLSDAMLNEVGGARPANISISRSIDRTLGGAGSADAMLAVRGLSNGIALPIESNLLQASGVGATISRGLSPLGTIMSAMPGAK